MIANLHSHKSHSIHRKEMRMKRSFFVLCVVVLFLTTTASGQDLALKGGTVLTVTKGVIEGGTVLIQKGKITAVGKDVSIPRGVKVIDCTGKFIMPGLIDNHTHIAFDFGDVKRLPAVFI